jgi:hypothetical protein
MASRINAVGWMAADPANACVTFACNLRLAFSSAYTSGNQASTTSPTTDGLAVGADIDQLEAHQGKVSGVHTFSPSSTGITIGWLAPSSTFACGVDYGYTPFYNGSSGSWTRVAGSATARLQSIALTGLTAHALVYYRVNCEVMQPTGSVQLP